MVNYLFSIQVLRQLMYNNELIFVLKEEEYMLVELENCQKEGKILKCKIPKSKFDVFASQKNSLKVYYANEKIDYGLFDFVGSIEINYPQVTQTDIYFHITKIMNPKLDVGSYVVVFETNVTKIDKIKTNQFRGHYGEENETLCYFIKHDNLPNLYMACWAIESGTIE